MLELDEFEGKRYEMIRASEVGLDGMVLELWEALPGDTQFASGDQLIRAVYLDSTGEMTITMYREEISDSLLAWFRRHAWRAPPPKDKDTGSAPSG